jgi:tetratricopeptide (TPR) repeat protein
MSPKAVFAFAAFSIAAALPAGPASAAAFVIGGGMANACSRAAIEGRDDRESLDQCNMALESQPLVRRDRASTLVNRGVIQLRRKAYDAAREDFDAALRLEPAMGEALVNRGASLIAEKSFREGIDEIDRGLALGADEPEKAYFNRALAWEGLDEPKAAWLDYQKALELAPDWEAPRRELARFSVSRR